MGLLATDITPLQSVSPLIPTSKDVQTKVFRVARTDSTAAVEAILPADASIIEISKFGATNSDAGTSSTLTITVANNTGTISTGTVDLKTAGTTTAHIQMSDLPNLQAVPAAGDIKISAQVVEVGTASTTGGPWYIKVLYVR